MTNFIQQPLPQGSTTGAIKGLPDALVPGALGQGQRAAFGITTFNVSFRAHLVCHCFFLDHPKVCLDGIRPFGYIQLPSSVQS